MLRRSNQPFTHGTGRALWLAAVVTLLMSCADELPIAPDRAPGTAQLVAPSNDAFATATMISALPFDGPMDNTDATAEAGEPTASCSFGSSGKTVWYSFTPAATGWVVARIVPGFFSPVVGVYTGTSVASLTEVACRVFVADLAFQVQGGTTYYFQVDGVFGGSGAAGFQLEGIPVPPNDNFANAALIPALPFSNPVNMAPASLEAADPLPSCAVALGKTLWYSFKPTATGSISAIVINSSFAVTIAAYTGASLASLTEVGCQTGFVRRLTFRAERGRTYYFQVNDQFGEGGPLEFDLDVAPPPVANFYYAPLAPSVFDVIQFYENSFDGGDVPFASRLWHLGDGTTSTDCCPTHQYAKDKSYTVRVKVTTLDGRTATTSQTVVVQTHDVAITKFAAPASAKAGQTKPISVGLSNHRYSETVEVQLFRSVPTGFELVSASTLTVPVLAKNRTTDVTFNYTFTAADAATGKVTFKAVAVIQGVHDALVADNEAIAPPTKVRR